MIKDHSTVTDRTAGPPGSPGAESARSGPGPRAHRDRAPPGCQRRARGAESPARAVVPVRSAALRRAPATHPVTAVPPALRESGQEAQSARGRARIMSQILRAVTFRSARHCHE
eukprot:555198-Hanusia_phi.AAC.1